MSDSNGDPKTQDQTPEAEVQTNKRFSFSIIWLIPLIALAIGGWLAFKAITEQGPTITITFKTAEGLEAGKTKVKYKNVEIGKVESIDLSEDDLGVVLTVNMVKGVEPYMTDKTQFWVVRARVAAGKVSDLGTLFSGAYIGIDPIKEGKSTKSFTGLEVPPVVTTDDPGRMFFLKAQELGSIDIGAPVYYRGIKVGQVVHYDFDETGKAVDVRIFIQEPHFQEVTANTRFWNASGIDLSLDATGIEVNTQSLVSIMVGGIAFGLPEKVEPGDPAEENSFFNLYPDHKSINQRTYTVKNYWYLYFSEGESVRGLSIGAPVEYRGLPFGEVVDMKVEFLEKTKRIRIAVLIALEPERYFEKDRLLVAQKRRKETNKRMFKQGVHAQLQSGNLLTGQRYVEIKFGGDVPKGGLAYRDDIPIMPTVPATMEQVSENLGKIVKSLGKVRFDKIGSDLEKTIKSLNQTLHTTEKMVSRIDSQVTPNINKTMVQIQKSVKDLEASLGTDSKVNYNLRKALQELTLAIRSLRTLSDYVERHPEAIFTGKKPSNNER